MDVRTPIKKLGLAAALFAALPTVAFAQALQVFVFGDAGVVAQSDKPITTAKGASPGTSLSLNSGPWQASRLGFRGKFKLNDDFDAWYDAATTINLTQGLVGNNSNCSGTVTVTTSTATPPVTSGPIPAYACNQFFLFDRNAFVGFSSKTYGNLTFGRHPTVVTETIWVADPLKANNGATNPNVRFGYLVAPGPIVFANFGTNPGNNNNGVALDRQSNSARYIYTNTGFIGEALVGLGGVTGDRSRNLYAGLMLGYDSDGAASHGPTDRPVENVPAAFSLRAAGQMFNDNGTMAGTAAVPNVVSMYSWSVGGVGRYGPFKLKLTYSGSNIDNDSYYESLTTKVAAAGVTYLYESLDLTLAAYNVNRKMTNQPIEDATKIYFVPEWYWTKNFWLYAIFDYEIFNTPAVTTVAAPANTHGTAQNLGSIGPIDASATGGNVLDPGVKNSFYFGLGLSFIFTS